MATPRDMRLTIVGGYLQDDWRLRPNLTVNLGLRYEFNQPTLNANLVVGVIGALLLIGMLALMYRVRREISIEAIVWTLGISFLALTSEYVWPNPRLLITAFPAMLVFARRLQGKHYVALIATNALLLIGLSAITYVGVTLRP